MQGRSVIILANTKPESFVRPNHDNFWVPEIPDDDFHINPSSCAGVSGKCLEAFRCTICKRFPTQVLYECKEWGHAFCEDCFCYIDPEDGCVCRTGGRLDRCYSPYWTTSPSQLLTNMVQTLKYGCLDNACPQTSIAGEDWRTHLENCEFLRDFIHCPDVMCNGTSIPRTNFLSHCKEIHGVLQPTNLEKNKRYIFNLEAAKFENGQSLAMALKCNDRTLYVVGSNERSSKIRLAVFISERDIDWATEFCMKMIAKNESGQNLSATFKINPSERDWNDVQIFERSQILLYEQLDEILGIDKNISMAEKRYRLEFEIMDTANKLSSLPEGSTWEPLSPEENTVKDVKTAGYQPDNVDRYEHYHSTHPYATDYNFRTVNRTAPSDILIDDTSENTNINYASRYTKISNVRALRYITSEFK